VIQNDYQNPFLTSEKEEQDRIEKQEANMDRLSVPRRPHWEKSMTAEQVQRNERESFLNWRRDMAMLEDEEGLLLTPFEKNLEVWRQLWRVIERSQLVVQIVDARNPLLFRSADLEKYVKEVDANKNNLLLINKADFLTQEQRRIWADYFDEKGIKYTFFSATLAAQSKQEEEEAKERAELEASMKIQQVTEDDSDEDDDDEEEVEEEDDEEEEEEGAAEEEQDTITESLSKVSLDESNQEKEDVEQEDDRTRIRTTTNLLDLLIDHTPVVKGKKERMERV
jgi:large subunit GTPase 1